MWSRTRTRALVAAAATCASVLLLPPATASAEVSERFDVGADVVDVESAADGRLLVLSQQSHDRTLVPDNALQVFNGEQRTGAVQLDLTPTAMAYDAARDRAYVIGSYYSEDFQQRWALTAVDLSRPTAAAPIPLEGRAFEVAADAASGKVFVANLGDWYASPRVDPHLLVLDDGLRQIVRVPTPDPTYLAVAPGGDAVYLNDQASVSVHRASNGYAGEVLTTVFGATRMTLSADASKLYVGSQQSKLIVIDTQRGTRTDSSDLAGDVIDVAVNSDGSRLLVAQNAARKVSVVDAVTLERIGVVVAEGAPLALHRALGTDTTYARSADSRWLTRITPSSATGPAPRVSAVASTVREGDVSLDDWCKDLAYLHDYCREDNTNDRELKVTLSSPSAEAIEIAYRVGTPGSAVDGRDYYAYSGTLLIPAGATTGLAGLTVIADDDAEPAESLTLEITSALGAEIGNATAVITIADDDGPTSSFPESSQVDTGVTTSPAFGAKVVAGEHLTVFSGERVFPTTVMPEVWAPVVVDGGTVMQHVPDAVESWERLENQGLVIKISGSVDLGWYRVVVPTVTADPDTGAPRDDETPLYGIPRFEVVAPSSGSQASSPPPSDTGTVGMDPLTIVSPAEGAQYEYGQTVVASWGAGPTREFSAELYFGVGVAPVAYPLPGEPLPLTKPGPYRLRLVERSEDEAREARDVNFVVLDPVALAPGNLLTYVNDGATVTTGDVANQDAPLQTAIDVPGGVSGLLEVSTVDAPTDPAVEPVPAGFGLLGKILEIHGPDADPAGDPYRLTFTLDASLIQGMQLDDLQVFRNGKAMPDCYVAGPSLDNPCVEDRFYVTGVDGLQDAVLKVMTYNFSAWAIGAKSPSTVEYAGASNGLWTNKKKTVSFNAQVASPHAGCLAGRDVTFTVKDVSRTVPTDADGRVSALYDVTGWPHGDYPVRISVAASSACAADPDGASGLWRYPADKPTKKK